MQRFVPPHFFSRPHHHTQSVVATGGVYKGQGQSRRRLVTRAYEEFRVQDRQLQRSIPGTARLRDSAALARHPLAARASVARVRPRTSKGITDLLLPPASRGSLPRVLRVRTRNAQRRSRSLPELT